MKRQPMMQLQNSGKKGDAHPSSIYEDDGRCKDSKEVRKFDLDMNSDYNKERAHNLKEELLYVIDEKNQQSDLTEKGRSLISPSDPDGFVIPDLATPYVEIDRKNDLSDDDKRREQSGPNEIFK